MWKTCQEWTFKICWELSNKKTFGKKQAASITIPIIVWRKWGTVGILNLDDSTPIHNGMFIERKLKF